MNTNKKTPKTPLFCPQCVEAEIEAGELESFETVEELMAHLKKYADENNDEPPKICPHRG